MVGKDILRFHAVYWPAFLMAAGLERPRRVFAHGWWTNEGQKISKSLGNVIDPFELIERYGLDPVRYFLLREVPFGQDGDFSHRAIVHRINGDLANDLGNLAQRVLSLIYKNCKAKVPEPGNLPSPIDPSLSVAQRHKSGELIALLGKAHDLVNRVRETLERQAFTEALDEVWNVIHHANRNIDLEAPWALKKTDVQRMNLVLYVHAEVLRHVAIVLSPFMPHSCSRLLDQLAVPKDTRGFENLSTNEPPFLRDDRSIKPGTILPMPTGIFPRHVEPGSGPESGPETAAAGKASHAGR
jgi:methionyl-tRNA synthetase